MMVFNVTILYLASLLTLLLCENRNRHNEKTVKILELDNKHDNVKRYCTIEKRKEVKVFHYWLKVRPQYHDWLRSLN